MTRFNQQRNEMFGSGFRIATLATVATLAMFATLAPVVAEAQPGGRGSGGGFDRNAPPWSFRNETPLEYLKRKDSNGNGLLDPNEISDHSRPFYEQAAKGAGLDLSRPIPIERFAEVLRTMGPLTPSQPTSSGSSGGPSFGSTPGSTPPSSGFGSSSGSSSKSSDKSKTPGVPGFGVAMDLPKAAGFTPDNKPAAIPTSAPANTTATSSSSSGGSADDKAKYRRYAEGLMQKYDENKDGKLQKDEWSKMSESYHSADHNGDGIITLDELMEHLEHPSGSSSKKDEARVDKKEEKKERKDEERAKRDEERRGGPSGSSGGPTGSSGGPPSSGSGESRDRGWGSFGKDRGGSKSAATIAAAKGKRFLTPTERLPEGLPDWFIRADADGDGQVTMAEYSPVYTDAKAAEFAKYDLNGDGVITPQEVLQIERSSEKRK